MAAAPAVEIPVRQVKPTSRVVFTQGGRGGVGKTAFSTLLVEWYRTKNAPLALIDMSLHGASGETGVGSIVEVPRKKKSGS